MLLDLRFALRSLIRTPGFTLVAVVLVALGVGASTAIYSVIDGVLLEPFPYEEAERLVAVSQVAEETGAIEGISVANAQDLRERMSSFEAVATMEPYGIDYVGSDGPVALDAWLVSEDFFRVMGVAAGLGRTLMPEDYRLGRRVVVIGHGVWRDRFGGDPAIVGRVLGSGDGAFEVVGVMPAEFDYPGGRHVWVPVRYDPAQAEENRGAAYLEAVARLAPGAAVEEAASELETVMGQLRAEYPRANAGYTAGLAPIRDSLLGEVRPALLVLLAASGLLLLMATANLANLMLVRGAARSRTTAIRAALGAGRRRLLRYAFVESVILGVAGGVFGVMVAVWTLDAMLAFAPAELPRLDGIAVDGSVLAFATLLSLASVVLFGAVPAFRFSRADTALPLRGGGRGNSASRGDRRLRSALVATQVAVAVVLLTGAGLVVKSFMAVISEERGYDPTNVVATTVQAWGYFRSPSERTTFVGEAVARLEALPGVEAAGLTSALPLAAPIGNEHADLSFPGRPEDDRSRPVAYAASVHPGYFTALEIPLRAGRMLDDRDRAGGRPVALVNETLARRYFGDGRAVGERMWVQFWGPEREMEVVGVVADVRTGTLEEPPPPTLYVPHAQAPTGALTFVVRTAGEPAASMEAIRQALWEFHGSMPIEAQTTLATLLEDSLRARRFHLFLLGTFSAVALVLAGIGIYGVVSYTTRGRTREIGIRLALGATARDIMVGVLRRGGVLVGVGLAVGVAFALAAGRLMESLLYEVSPGDPGTLAGVVLILGAIGLAATALPARAAARVDPVEGMRDE